MKYTWWNGWAARGVENTYEEAVEALFQHLDFAPAWESYSPDGGTTYFYSTEEAQEADQDGAYAAQITQEV